MEEKMMMSDKTLTKEGRQRASFLYARHVYVLTGESPECTLMAGSAQPKATALRRRRVGKKLAAKLWPDGQKPDTRPTDMGQVCKTRRNPIAIRNICR